MSWIPVVIKVHTLTNHKISSQPRKISPTTLLGAQWLSGTCGVLDSRPRVRGFERHCVVSLSKIHLSLLSTGSPRKNLPYITETLLTGS